MMKKSLLILMIILTTLSVTSCGKGDGKRTVRYDAVYDTKTKQYIALGDSKDQVESIVGSGKNVGDAAMCEYEGGLTVWCDPSMKVIQIHVSNYDVLDPVYPEIEPRYEFFGNIMCGMEGTKVAKAYPGIQEEGGFYIVKDENVDDEYVLSAELREDVVAYFGVIFENGKVTDMELGKK